MAANSPRSRRSSVCRRSSPGRWTTCPRKSAPVISRRAARPPPRHRPTWLNPGPRRRRHFALMALVSGEGSIRKMLGTLDEPVRYALPLGDEQLLLNDLLGRTIRLEALGEIRCQHCNRLTKKSYSQGFCFPCMKKLAQCDLCIVSPERCHYEQGTCREPAWGEQFCMTDHIVYLANS